MRENVVYIAVVAVEVVRGDQLWIYFELTCGQLIYMEFHIKPPGIYISSRVNATIQIAC